MKPLESFTVPTASCADADENMNRDAMRISAPANGRNLALLFTIYPLLFGFAPWRRIRFLSTLWWMRGGKSVPSRLVPLLERMEWSSEAPLVSQSY